MWAVSRILQLMFSYCSISTSLTQQPLSISTGLPRHSRGSGTSVSQSLLHITQIVVDIVASVEQPQPQCTNTFIILHSMPFWGLGISTTKDFIVLRKQLETWQKLFFIKLTSFTAHHYILTVSEFSFVLVLNTISERAHSKATSPHVHQARTQWWSLHSNYESPPWYQHKMSILLQREPTLARRMVGNSRRVLYFHSHWMFEPQEPRPESLTIPPIKLKRN